MTLIDTHCHLQASVFAPDREAVFARARVAGVHGFLCCGTEPQDWEDVAQLSRDQPGVVPAYGVHPWYIPNNPESALQALEQRLATEPQAWVGEIGLDRTFGPPLAQQEAVFEPQLAVAQRFRRPVSLHCRRTWDRLLLYLKRWPAPAVLHSFSGSEAVARQLLDRGDCWFSFSGALTRSRNTRLPALLKYLPRSHVLIETDAPDLTPWQVWREAPGARNEPAYLLHTANQVAEVWDLSLEETAQQLTANAQALGWAGQEDQKQAKDSYG